MHGLRRILSAVAGAALTVALVGAVQESRAAPVSPDGDRVILVDGGGRWHIRIDDAPDYTFWYGGPGDVPLLGDWDGDGIDTPGAWRPEPGGGHAYLTNRLPADGAVGVAEFDFLFGLPGDDVFSGDWDGDGVDTLGAFRRGQVFLSESNRSGGSAAPTDHAFWFGSPGDRPLAGDPGGSGFDRVLIYRPSTGELHVSSGIPPGNVAGTAATRFFGIPGDRPLTGDWDGDGRDTAGGFRPSPAMVLLSNAALDAGAPVVADVSYAWGSAGWAPLAGNPGAVPPLVPAEPAVVLAAGDIADCRVETDSATAAIVARYPGAEILALGDTVYQSGTPDEYTRCWDPTWGTLPQPIHPTPGNHEYYTAGATGYFGYFGVEPYYSFDLGGWHLISLNSEIPTGPGSPQHAWLEQDLREHPAECTLALWHSPRWTTAGHQPGSPVVQPFWDLLYDSGADVVLNGHDHAYQRFTPLDATGRADPSGMRQFVVGTGGSDLDDQVIQDERLEVFSATFGVLKLRLGVGEYEWEFLPIPGEPFTDTGTGRCRP